MRTSIRRLAFLCAAAATVAIVTSPAWAAFPDQGNRIVYGRSPQTSTVTAGAIPRGVLQESDLYSIRSNGDDRERLTNTAAIEYGAYYSPDGDRLVYWAVAGGDYRVYTADPDGSHRQALTSNPVSVMPNWSKNGRQIVYVRYQPARLPASPLRRGGGPAELMVMDADGGGKHAVHSAEAIWLPGWSPTRSEIAMTIADGPDTGSVYLLPPSGGEPQLVCCKGGTALFADWAPDGNRLLLTVVPETLRGETPPATVYTIKRNGNDPVVVTDQSYYLTVPRFTADGERVVFSRDTGDTLDLYSVRSDGTGGRKQLTDTRPLEFLNLLLFS
jgi:hypothetical protein